MQVVESGQLQILRIGSNMRVPSSNICILSHSLLCYIVRDIFLDLEPNYVQNIM